MNAPFVLMPPQQLEFTSQIEAEVGQVVEDLILDEKQLNDRRTFNREPFCRPVTITLMKPEGNSVRTPRRQWSAFCRDISSGGVGLLSRIAVAPQTYFMLTVPRSSAVPVILKTEARWCERYCEGLFVIGGRLHEAIDAPWTQLDILA